MSGVNDKSGVRASDRVELQLRNIRKRYEEVAGCIADAAAMRVSELDEWFLQVTRNLLGEAQPLPPNALRAVPRGQGRGHNDPTLNGGAR